jgi:hypothetical protein
VPDGQRGLHLAWVDADLSAPADLNACLHGLATRLVWRSGGWAEEAIDVACALVVAGRSTSSTVELCALPRGADLADVEPLVRAVLAERGFPLPPESPTDAERFAYLLRGFALGVISFNNFYGEFYAQLQAWDHQSPMERQLTLLLDSWEHEDDVAGKRALVAEMRAVVSDYAS